MAVLRRLDPAAELPDQNEFRVRWSWALFVSGFLSLAVLLAARTLLDRTPENVVAVALLALLGGAALVHRRAADTREFQRIRDVGDLTRVVRGFSRADSPDEVADAILRELGRGTGADHVVVVRRRPDAPVLDATLVSMRPGVPTSSALLPAADLDDDRWANPLEEPGRTTGVPVGPGRSDDDFGIQLSMLFPDPLASAEAAAARIERRVRRAFGLKHTLAVPLISRDAVMGAIVISRRRDEGWPDSARRLLEVASVEATAALARVNTLRDAEARATTDTLTGLPNCRYFEEYVDLVRRSRRSDDVVGILMVDVDRFKLVNDRFGHATGDVVLREVGRAISQAVRDVDLPARYGGEEFVVMLRNPSDEVAREVGERIRAAVARLDLSRVGMQGVTVSVGASIARAQDESVSAIVARADHALYRAKRYGRNRVEAA